VFCDKSDLTKIGACEEAVSKIGVIDILVANLASPTFSGIDTKNVQDEDWQTPFEIMVHPLHRLVRAVLSQMIERKQGKIVVYGSASALKGMKTLAAYSAARAAQLGYVQSVGVEVAASNVQINLIAQNYIENEVYYPPSLTQKTSFKLSLKRQVRAGRLGTAEEDAALALSLASGDSGFFAGQAIPHAGGWVQQVLQTTAMRTMAHSSNGLCNKIVHTH
jgi:2-keto-3-deoxy-L-fuconate dehydrogenase